ncbi:unnamed protein product [Medioppia subpectinata]|uniref:NACHT domain-containing protein n=1 Tax=Medioppia subpectinata TaxID=1979941 RepID=A0A7R9Q164_9ACAR|nr:unnamed protein product [Medioppia subpectinata]CAG2108893.1 unnamed protein product [Medioppia subpectinata]
MRWGVRDEATVTEREITNGILNVLNVKRHCLAYFRQINKIDATNTRVVEKFIDLTAKGDIDREAQTLLNHLRDTRLIAKIFAPNLVKFTVDWNPKQGLDIEQHFEYLKEFCEHFYNNITKLVRKAMRREDRSPFGSLFNEILHHLHSCNHSVQVFEGRHKQLHTIENYIKSNSNSPLVLHGLHGSGKTSLLAKAATLLEEWVDRDNKFILILRFIGTTPDSSSVIPFLTSICQQISYNFMLPLDDVPDDLIGLTFHFKQLLLKTREQLVFIFIDSIDQLSENMESSIKLSFLSQQFPDNLKVVISCSSEDRSKDFETLHKMIEQKDKFVEVEELGAQLGIDVIKRWLQLIRRDITAKQWQTVGIAINDCSLPIFAKLVFAEIIRWKSYSKANQTLLSNTVMDSIFRLFDRIEVQHGKTLVSHALSYITASKNGLSESELEDMLSLDDIVLDDVFQYHLPPVRRIPPLLWTRIRNDLPNYLTERDANGVNAMNWYHKQFRDASIQRYFISDTNTHYFHSSIADYYMGVWGGGVDKPFKYTESQKQRFKLIEEESKADRKVPTQPLAYFSIDGRITRYNLRKLAELPYHLIRAKRFNDLLKTVLFDYNWLHSKLSCFPLQSILADFEDSIHFLSKEGGHQSVVKEISLLADTLKLSAPVIVQFPNMIGPQILARLLCVSDECLHIRNLLQQCDSKGALHCALLPVNHCLHTPGGPLMYSLEGHHFKPVYNVGLVYR